MQSENRRLNKRIKIKGLCPICGNKLTIGSWMYEGEPKTETFFVQCVNKDCDEHYGYGSSIIYRFVNHRTIKIVGK